MENLTFYDYVVPIFIYIILPLIGLGYYIYLALKMKAEVKDPPYITVFSLFYIYGGLLVSLLTALFWKYSGMMTILVFFQTFAAPVIVIFIAILNYPKRQKSVYHRWSFYGASAYILIMALAIVYFTQI